MDAQSTTHSVFGTDGIRGKVGKFPLTTEGCAKIGWATGCETTDSTNNLILIGRDTRSSGLEFEKALKTGCLHAGANVLMVGVLPTPAVAYLVKECGACLGLVVSGSHNPVSDNGIKFFSCDGSKISATVEQRIQKRLREPTPPAKNSKLGRTLPAINARNRYKQFCQSIIQPQLELNGIHIVLDCANGACSQLAPEIFEALGAQVTVIGNEPDGMNIHVGCGSTNPAALAQVVVERKANIGFAFDGDGDRVIVVDATGQVRDGDYILYAFAKEQNFMGDPLEGVVSTVMANFGLERALARLGTCLERVDVGDRNVQRRLAQRKWLFGGEPSGHIYCRADSTTGDGIVTAMFVLQTCQRMNSNFESIVADLEKLPAKLVNVPVNRPDQLTSSEKFRRQIASCQEDCEPALRVNVRPSGTEPVVRILVEGVDAKLVESKATEVANMIFKYIAEK